MANKEQCTIQDIKTGGHFDSQSSVQGTFEKAMGLSCIKFLKGLYEYYRQTSNVRHTLVGSKIVDHSYVVGASPVGAAPTAPSFST